MGADALRRALVALLLLTACGCDVAVREARLRLNGGTEGKLVANIGMPLEEAARRSTLKLADSYHSDAGERVTAANAAFDFEVADTGARFEKCYYYWLATAKGDDTRLEYITVGFPGGGLARAQLPQARADVQARLAADGWDMGHYLWKTEEQKTLHRGEPDGTGFYWAKGGTLLILREKRIDDERPGEDTQAGTFILYLELTRRDSELHKDLVFDPPRR